MPAALTEAEAAERLAVIEDHRQRRRPATEVARALGLTVSAMRKWLSDRGQPGYIVSRAQVTAAAADSQAEAPEPEPDPVEERRERFLRRQVSKLESDLTEARLLCDELAGFGRLPSDPPQWARDASSGSGSASVIVAHTSDWHVGERIAPGEVQGVNAFDETIAAARLGRYFNAVAEIGNRWAASTELRGCLFTMAGDMISGSIHEELEATQALTSFEQCALAADIAEAGLRVLLEAYNKVHVIAVPGNHGRATRKSWAKKYGHLSYDILIAARLMDRFRGDGRVTWQIDGQTDQLFRCLGLNLAVTHGDKLGTGGGRGFIGPLAPMTRGLKSFRSHFAGLGHDVDLVLAGHWHTSANIPGALFNGSVPGYSEFGRDIRAGVEPAQQWVARITDKWGVYERCEVRLDERPVALVNGGADVF